MQEHFIQDSQLSYLKNKVKIYTVGDENNPIALFLPYISDSGKTCMNYLFHPLAENGYYVISIDFPG